ncbi:hypothetical protein MPSEU_000088700 [Mayamaea pseudoterrestris]|nr:hypothetical protein MPSEU_000088700 [Mayamaea pseudoterrestris]
MPLAVPAELKKIKPFLLRAEELDRDQTRPESRLVAYYLRQYAVQVGIPHSTLPESKVCLGHVLEALEAEQADMNQFTREEAALVCRQFCHKVFEKADGEDRMGLANKATAAQFYAASVFLQSLEQFAADEEQTEEDEKKRVYCKWKATDILKALKEGRQPRAGGYGQEDDVMNDDDDADNENDGSEKKEDAPEVQNAGVERVLTEEDGDDMDIESAPHEIYGQDDQKSHSVEHADGDGTEEEGTEVDLHLAPPPPAYPGPPPVSLDFEPPTLPVPPQAAHVPPVVSSTTASAIKKKSAGLFGFAKKEKSATKAQFDDAIELTNFALAALHDKDADLAAERLQQALVALGR